MWRRQFRIWHNSKISVLSARSSTPSQSKYQRRWRQVSWPPAAGLQAVTSKESCTYSRLSTPHLMQRTGLMSKIKSRSFAVIKWLRFVSSIKVLDLRSSLLPPKRQSVPDAAARSLKLLLSSLKLTRKRTWSANLSPSGFKSITRLVRKLSKTLP